MTIMEVEREIQSETGIPCYPDFENRWDVQMDQDAAEGRLDFLIEGAKQDILNGDVQDLFEVLGIE